MQYRSFRVPAFIMNAKRTRDLEIAKDLETLLLVDNDLKSRSWLVRMIRALRLRALKYYVKI
jgi:hypothetical protein